MISKKHIQLTIDNVMRFIKFRILHVDDSAHRISLGVALGLFIAWTPAFGLHLIIALCLAILLRANKFVALTSVWICNPFTFIIILYSNYILGRALLIFFRADKYVSTVSISELIDLLKSAVIPTVLFGGEFWKELLHLFGQMGTELWLGSVVAGTLIAVSSYFLTRHLINKHRSHIHS